MIDTKKLWVYFVSSEEDQANVELSAVDGRIPPLRPGFG
jgi:hypothetical protein